MADFLVLEEDGTSHLELEESSSDFVLEDGTFVYSTTGAGVAGILVGGAAPAAPTSAATWQVGVITVPGSTGSVTYSGLGGTPKAVFFWGANWLTEDASVTTSGSGLFRGMACLKYDDPGTILQGYATLDVTGDAQIAATGRAIDLLDASGSTGGARYEGTVTAFTGDGFTVNWTVVTSGYKVVYAALMDADEAGAFEGSGSTTVSLGWKAGGMMLHGAWGWPFAANADRTTEFFGSASYPGTASSGWYGSGLTAYSIPPASNAYNIGIFNSTPGVRVTEGGTFIGPFLSTSIVTAVPTGTDLEDFKLDSGVSDNGGMVVAWSDEHGQSGNLTPGASNGDVVTVSGLPFTPNLLIGYSIGDEPQGAGSSGTTRGAVGFSVVAPGFQWTALADGVGVGAYQSFQRGVVDNVNGSNVHAATVELTGDGFTVTTEEDDISPASWVWHVFGGIEPVFWIPQIYRRQT